MKLEEGEVICSQCNGKGSIPREKVKGEIVIANICRKCHGAKKVDWISNIIGLKPEVYVEPGVYTKEIDFSEYIRREVNNASVLFQKETYKAIRKKVKKELEPMTKVIFEYHLKKFKKGESKMPGNTVKINNRSELEWYIPDRSVDGLINWLNQAGVKTETTKYKINALRIWVSNLVYPYKNAQFIDDVEEFNEPGVEHKWKFNLYTQRYLYRITAIDRKKDEGYLGCTFSCRSSRAGETWTRGGDLPDGPFTQETWERIKNAILRHEFVELAPPSIPIPDECEKPTTLVGSWNPEDNLCDGCEKCNEDFCKPHSAAESQAF